MKLANFEYFSITRGKMHHFRLKSGALLLNGKAFTLNKTNKTYTVEWNFQAVSCDITKSGKLCQWNVRYKRKLKLQLSRTFLCELLTSNSMVSREIWINMHS